MVRDSLGIDLLSFLPIFVIISRAILSSLEVRDCNILAGDGSGFWRPLYWKSPSAKPGDIYMTFNVVYIFSVNTT